MDQTTPTINGINEYFLSKICLELLKDIPRYLRERDLSYPEMGERTYLLMALYNRIREKLFLPPKNVAISSEEGSRLPLEREIRSEITILFEIEPKMKRYFNYDLIIDQFLEEGLKGKKN
jgi:hypothetical protein